MQLQGIKLDPDDVAYNLLEKLNLSDMQEQMLATATGSEPSQNVIERETTRLFKRIHVGQSNVSSLLTNQKTHKTSNMASQIEPKWVDNGPQDTSNISRNI